MSMRAVELQLTPSDLDAIPRGRRVTNNKGMATPTLANPDTEEDTLLAKAAFLINLILGRKPLPVF